ncbi:hypothetical protein [Nonomuraea endophytica]|uniref:hypothetical protein n=1 Tax=Nonomuraea endophytica TaxID=714136 RepID=UPI0037C52D33
MADQLVATGTKAVDAYLKIAHALLVPQRTLEDAERRLERAEAADRECYGGAGTAEARRRAERSYDTADRDVKAAWRFATCAEHASETADPRMHELATLSIDALWESFYDRPQLGDVDAFEERRAGDLTAWNGLETGDQIHMTYQSGRRLTWTFVDLAGAHPENDRLDIVLYAEEASWRDPSVVRGIAVFAANPVADLHKTAHTVTITRRRSR